MKYRKPMNRRRSRKLFSRTASKVNKKNFKTMPFRGGYRL